MPYLSLSLSGFCLQFTRILRLLRPHSCVPEIQLIVVNVERPVMLGLVMKAPEKDIVCFELLDWEN